MQPSAEADWLRTAGGLIVRLYVSWTGQNPCLLPLQRGADRGDRLVVEDSAHEVGWSGAYEGFGALLNGDRQKVGLYAFGLDLIALTNQVTRRILAQGFVRQIVPRLTVS